VRDRHYRLSGIDILFLGWPVELLAAGCRRDRSVAPCYGKQELPEIGDDKGLTAISASGSAARRFHAQSDDQPAADRTRSIEPP
jgi:hypothetical protein